MAIDKQQCHQRILRIELYTARASDDAGRRSAASEGRISPLWITSTLAISALMAAFIASCTQQPAEAPTKGDSAQRYAMNVVVSQVPFWSESRATLKFIDGNWEDEIVFGGPENDDVLRQNSELDALLIRGLDGLIITPTDSTQIATKLEELHRLNIPFVTFLVDAPEAQRVTYITSDLEEASIQLLDSLKGRLPSDGEAVILIGTAGSEEQERRAEGFRTYLESKTPLKLAGILEDEFDERKGADRLKAIILKRPGIKAIFGCNSRSAAAALTALRELAREPSEYFITGWDKDLDVLEAITAGDVAASAGQRSSFMVYLAYSILELLNEGGEMAKHIDIPEKISIPIEIIDKSNVARYLEKR
jgi:ABC-type sugar transport system substrate-binding protein